MPPFRQHTIDLDHFERVYAAKPDPWRYSTSPYEAGKYAATLAALPRERYTRAFEIGCSIGVLTGQLATRCDSLLASEPVEGALHQARERNAHHAHLSFASHFVPQQWPDGRFDLILISEVLDFLGQGDLDRLADRICDSLEPDGDLVLVHWVGKKGPVSSGNEGTDVLLRAAGDRLSPMNASRNRDYRIDIMRRQETALPTPLP